MQRPAYPLGLMHRSARTWFVVVTIGCVMGRRRYALTEHPEPAREADRRALPLLSSTATFHLWRCRHSWLEGHRGTWPRPTPCSRRHRCTPRDRGCTLG